MVTVHLYFVGSDYSQFKYPDGLMTIKRRRGNFVRNIQP